MHRVYPHCKLKFTKYIFFNMKWTQKQVEEIYETPLLQLLAHAAEVHKQHHPIGKMQLCSLISVKTGGCPEDCRYCAQSSRYPTPLKAEALLSYEEVMRKARASAKNGVTRICLGAAWREVRDNKPFREIVEMVKGIQALGIQVCCTLGMVKPAEAQILKQAGAYAYNHNLDTSEKFYPSIITTRTYQDRLNTLDVIQQAGLSVCCGGILGLGEQIEDRLQLLLTLANRDPPPDSVPINQFVPTPGVPLENQPPVPFWELLRVIATARILMPMSVIRLSAGRHRLNFEQQTLCFLAGINSLWLGEKLLTVINQAPSQDEELFRLLGINA